MPANQAFAQVDPRVPDFQAILTTISARCNLPDLIEMCTLFCHEFLLSLYVVGVEYPPGQDEVWLHGG